MKGIGAPRWPNGSLLAALLGSLAMLAAVTSGCGSAEIPQLASGQQYYVSLGDSYAAGFQPTGPRSGHNTRSGFAYQIPGKAASKGYQLRLVNYGCDGATSSGMLSERGCPAEKRGPGEPSYGNDTQIAAATRLISAHPRRVGLITISVGANDVLPCLLGRQPTSCLTDATRNMETNVRTLASRLRAAVGPGVPILGTTYPNVFLAYYLSKDPKERALVPTSVDAFKSLINPALHAAYASADGQLVDVTAASGAYGPLSETTHLAPYGTIPVPVARVCQLTFMCQQQNIHPTDAGYAFIAGLVVDALPPAPPPPART